MPYKMTLDLTEASVVFTMLCYKIQDNKLLTEGELALYHRFRSAGWDDLVNCKRDLIKELSNVSA